MQTIAERDIYKRFGALTARVESLERIKPPAPYAQRYSGSLTVNAGAVADASGSTFATPYPDTFEEHAAGIKIMREGIYLAIAFTKQTSFTTTETVNLEVTQRYYASDGTTIVSEHQNELMQTFTKDYRGVTGAPSHTAFGLFAGGVVAPSMLVVVAKIRNQSASNISFGRAGLHVFRLNPTGPTFGGSAY